MIYNPDEVQKQLENILSGEEYLAYNNGQGGWKARLETIIQWILDLIAKMFPGVSFSGGLVGIVTYIVIAVGLLLLIILAFFFVRRFVLDGKRRHESLGTRRDFSMAAMDHLQAASDFSRAGEYQKALRHLFLAMLIHLDEKKWLRAKPWKTNGEYYEELLDHAPFVAERFHEMAEAFNESFYGGHPITQDAYMRFSIDLEKLMEGDEQ